MEIPLSIFIGGEQTKDACQSCIDGSLREPLWFIIQTVNIIFNQAVGDEALPGCQKPPDPVVPKTTETLIWSAAPQSGAETRAGVDVKSDEVDLTPSEIVFPKMAKLIGQATGKSSEHFDLTRPG